MFIEPAVLPAGSPTSDHRVRLRQQQGVDPSIHGLSVGDSRRLTPLQLDEDGVAFFVAPVHPAGFHRLVVQVLEGWQTKKAQGKPSLTWESPVALEYLELPQMHSLLPDQLRGGPILAGTRHMVVVAGRNFTSATRCVVGGAAAPTRWLASNLLECEVLEPGLAGGTAIVQLLERGLYYSRGPGLDITFTA